MTPIVPNPDEIRETIELVTSTMFDVAPSSRSTRGDAARDPVQWTADVAIHGRFNGTVRIVCSRTIARWAAATLTECDASDDDARDTLGELVNVIGGNIKALVSEDGEPCRLSLPRADAPPSDDRVVCEWWTHLGPEEHDEIGVFLLAAD